ncbi:putative transmembrane protein [Senna tora]|uniref:Putative transmembrane protein n=1 Tax=Senna tora TaxID=362788 RepID=A0A834SLG8_9FABA|nr:putative transmembrane protein [Senna tora]
MTPSRNLSFPYMATFTTCFFLFLILSLPYFSTGRSQLLESEMYEIDYRGPETHSSTPPPDHSHATSLGQENPWMIIKMGN